MQETKATPSELDAVTDAVLLSSRALVAVASRSIAAVDDAITLPQFRACGARQRRRRDECRGIGERAADSAVDRDAGLCDRLVRKRLARRRVNPTNRREVTIVLTSDGRALVREVTRRRRREIASIMARVPAAERVAIVEALTTFRQAAGEDELAPTVPW